MRCDSNEIICVLTENAQITCIYVYITRTYVYALYIGARDELRDRPGIDPESRRCDMHTGHAETAAFFRRLVPWNVPSTHETNAIQKYVYFFLICIFFSFMQVMKKENNERINIGRHVSFEI